MANNSIISTKAAKKSIGTASSKTSATAVLTIHGTPNKGATVPFPTAKRVPAGAYCSKILSVTPAKTNAGDDAADIVYRLTDQAGNVHDVRMRYPVGEFSYYKLGDALIAAGLENGAALTEAVGIEEEVILDYPYAGALGNFKTRTPTKGKPAKKVAPPVTVEDDEEIDDDVVDGTDDEEFDDFLEDDDED